MDKDLSHYMVRSRPGRYRLAKEAERYLKLTEPRTRPRTKAQILIHLYRSAPSSPRHDPD